ncbi:MAG: hypothetical protein JEY91_10715 [Spirochaetaceae bacterium]|nr:hypothetical protein [Spirochaetaceae bacterium]
MGRVLVVNLLFTFLVLAFLGTSFVAQFSLPLAGLLLFILFFLLIIYLGMAASYIKELNDFKAPEIKSLFKNIKSTWKSSLLGGVVFSAVLFFTVLGMRFYLSLDGILGIMGAIFLFWIFVTVSLASLYYFPVVNRLNSTFMKMMKKSFLIFLDNPFLTIFVFIGIIINLCLSVFTIFLIPGPAGVLIWIDNNLRLLIYKYDYLEENPDARRNIPWRALFLEDNEKIGPRSFRNTLFPWK